MNLSGSGHASQWQRAKLMRDPCIEAMQIAPTLSGDAGQWARP
jgi:hypothetical protein